MPELEPPTPVRIPLTRVMDVDNPDRPPRLVSLPARDAVLWCQGRDMGLTMTEAVLNLGPNVMYMNGHWICGPYKAKEDGWEYPVTTREKKSTKT